MSITTKWPYSTDGSPTYSIDQFDNLQYTKAYIAEIGNAIDARDAAAVLL